MTDQNMEHPTLGRRRRHKSPPSLQCTSALPVPRSADHLDTENGPSDEEGRKEAKRQKSEPTTPISPQADFHMNTMRLWESLKWILGKPKGLKRGWIRSTMMQQKNHQMLRDQSLRICLVFPTGVVVVRHCIELLNQTRSNSLLPPTLGSRLRSCPTRCRL